jgi:ParB-like chromosome segregation protein Spo0J
MQIAIENIIIPKGRRPLDQVKVEEIAESIKTIGLLQPIGVKRLGSSLIWDADEKVELVFGEHRLAAHLKLGTDIIEAFVIGAAGFPGHEEHAKLSEIAENLHRAELTTQQRNEYLAEWVMLLEKLAPPISDAERPISKPGRKPSPAVDAAAKMSGLSPKTVRQAIKSTKVSPEVKAAADKAELTSKQRLAISRLPEAEQLDAVHAAISAEADRAAGKPEKPKPDVSAPADRAEQQATLAHNEPAKLTPDIDSSRAAYLADIQALDLTFEQKAMEIHKIMEATGLWLRHGTFRQRTVS